MTEFTLRNDEWDEDESPPAEPHRLQLHPDHSLVVRVVDPLGQPVDFGKITDVAVKVVEGEKDDISAPGQCLAALDLLTGLPDSKKAAHIEPGAGHYGIFAGKSWRNNIRPLVLDFIDTNTPTRGRRKKSA